MRAMVCHRLTADRSGLSFAPSWAEPRPPGAGEVTVAVAHAALNYPDLLMLSGGYQFAPPLPFIPGSEGAGTIVAVGPDVDPTLVGCEVVAGARCGMFAERITLPLTAIRPRPAALAPPAAAAFTVAALTAYVALVRRGCVTGGERVLVAGAGGGTGLAAVALAKALDATVIGLVSSPAKAAAATAAGADTVHLVAHDAAVPPLAGIDVVFDPVGGKRVPSLVSAFRRGGRYLIVGFVGGITLLPFDRIGEIEVIGVRAGEFARRDPAGGIANLAAIDRLAAQLVPLVGLRVRLTDAGDAFAAMAAGTLTGKAVIDCA